MASRRFKTGNDKKLSDKSKDISKIPGNSRNGSLSFEDIETKIFEDLGQQNTPNKLIHIANKQKTYNSVTNRNSLNKIINGKSVDSVKSKSRMNEKSKITKEKIKKYIAHEERKTETPSSQKDSIIGKHSVSKLKIIEKPGSCNKNISKCVELNEKYTNIKEKIHTNKKRKEKCKANKQNKTGDKEKANKGKMSETLNISNKKTIIEKQKISQEPKLRNILKRANIIENNVKNYKINNPTSSNSHKKYDSKGTIKDIKSCSESEDEFGEVDELEEIMNAQSMKEETVQIELESTNIMWGITKRKHKNRKEMIEDYLRKQDNRRLKEIHENMHKTHLLCLIAHGKYVNCMINSEEIMTAALSINTNKKIYPDKRLNISHLELIIKWFKKIVDLIDSPVTDANRLLPLKEILVNNFKAKKAHSKEEFTLMFLALIRVLGINGRLVFNLVPLSWKVKTHLLIKPNISKKECVSRGKDKISNIGSKSRQIVDSYSSDSDFLHDSEHKLLKKKISKAETDKKLQARKESKTFLTYWLEVYTEEEEEWISIDVPAGEIHHSSEEFERKLAPLCGYILAYNNDLTFKDVTKRYVHNWLSSKDKVRFNSDWWEETIVSFRGKLTKREAEEDKYLDTFLEEQPLPKTLSSYKNHPLYVLQRQLLKFEGLYPPDVSPVGFFRGEPVFPRECVKQLHGREKWIKEGKTVIVGEEPYKIVKARPKWDKGKCQVIKDLTLEIFGEWQVEDYEPPVAADGKVPRNEYGNVELFKQSMLPKGCVHLLFPCINKLARKLGIDCAPAITGFDFHRGWTHPVFEGFIVCEEFQDVLIDAWRQEQVEAAKRLEEKRLRQIYLNWKKLIHGVMVKDRIQVKYGYIIENDKKTKKDKKPRKKIKLDDTIASGLSNKQRDSPSLKIDFESSAAESISKQIKKSQLRTELMDSSEDEATAGEKQKKIRTILSWNPTSSSQNPDLSDSDEEKLLDSVLLKQCEDNAMKAKRSKATIPTSEFSEQSLSEGSTTTSEMDFDIKPKKRSKRSRNRVSYKADSDSQVDFTDSDDDKAFEPDSKKRMKI